MTFHLFGFLLFLFPLSTTDASVTAPAASAHAVDLMQKSGLSEDEQENEFQNSVDTLVDDQWADVDTFAWDNAHINSGRFDSENWKDTARIVLVDSSEDRYFVPPFFNCITSNFGMRRWMWHYGVDIRLSKGDSVHTALDGVVRVIQYDRRGYGHVVVVRHSNGLETIYGHLSKVLTTANQRVSAGDVIGLGGSTGHSTGNHLHLETRYYGEPFDPNDMIDFKTGLLRHDTLTLTKENFGYLVEQRKAVWHKVRKGETLGRIARYYHTSIKNLCRLNHVSPRTKLSIGRKVLVCTDRHSSKKMSPAMSSFKRIERRQG